MVELTPSPKPDDCHVAKEFMVAAYADNHLIGVEAWTAQDKHIAIGLTAPQCYALAHELTRLLETYPEMQQWRGNPPRRTRDSDRE